MKRFAISLAIGLVAVAAAACGSQGSGSQSKTITVWKAPHTTQDASFFNQVGNEFASSNPGYTVQYRVTPWATWEATYTSAFAGGNPPDIFYDIGQYFTKFAATNQLVPLDKAFGGDFAAIKNQYDESTLNLATYKGHVYGIPFIQAGISLVWNKALFKKAGLNPNTPPRTWDEVQADAKKITDLNSHVYGYGMLDNSTGEMQSFYPSLLVDYGGAFTDSSGKWALDSPQAASGLDVLRSMYAAGDMPKFGTFQGHDVDTAFLNGKIGIMLTYSSFLTPLLPKYPGFDMGVGKVPCGPVACKSYGDIGFWSIANASNHKAADWKLVQKLASPGVATRYAKLSGLFPAQKGLNPFSGQPLLQSFDQTQGNYLELPRESFDYWSILNPQVQQAITGSESSLQALHTASEAIRNKIAGH